MIDTPTAATQNGAYAETAQEKGISKNGNTMEIHNMMGNLNFVFAEWGAAGAAVAWQDALALERDSLERWRDALAIEHGLPKAA